MTHKKKLEEAFWSLPKAKQKQLIKKLRFRKFGKKKLTIKNKEKFNL